MNKQILYFGIGAVLGAAGGSTATYFILKEKFAAMADEEIEAYAEHCEERIQKIRGSHNMVEKVEQKLTDDSNEDEINRNEGVKKYHHHNGISSKYGENNIFHSPEKKITEILNDSVKESKKYRLINEIDEDEFLNDDEKYAKQTLDVLLGDDQDVVAFWGYQTDNEEFVDTKFGKPLAELVGLRKDDYDYMLNETDNDEETGALYFRNDELMTDFEVIIHDMREDDK